MKLLLHACCADCTLKFIASYKESCELTVYYYNPNIHPRSEYQARLKAIKQICEQEMVELIIPDWKPKDYFDTTRSVKKSERCIGCWSNRLEKTAEYAAKNGYTHFGSTLVTSEYQDKNKIAKIAEIKARKYEIDFFIPKTICSELKTSGFYKQFFCGCVYSLTERFEEKYNDNSTIELPNE